MGSVEEVTNKWMTSVGYLSTNALQVLNTFFRTVSREFLIWSNMLSSELDVFWSIVSEFSTIKQRCMVMILSEKQTK
jgi:hypothetical protein